jgi:hypothetical protein
MDNKSISFTLNGKSEEVGMGVASASIVKKNFASF